MAKEERLSEGGRGRGRGKWDRDREEEGLGKGVSATSKIWSNALRIQIRRDAVNSPVHGVDPTGLMVVRSHHRVEVIMT